LIAGGRNFALSNENEVNRFLDDFEGEIKIVGMKENGGCIFPGFFSLPFSAKVGFADETQTTLSDEESKNPAHELKRDNFYDFKFVPYGKYDQNGHFRSFTNSESQKIHSDLKQKFPSLLETTNAQLRRKTFTTRNPFDQSLDTATIPAMKFRFCMKEGFELDLVKIFASGLWYADEANEFIFPGLFDSAGRFISAYCISKQGYLIPGCTNERRKFLPFSKYGSYEFKAVKVHTYSKTLNQDKMKVLEKLKDIPKFPLSNEILNCSHWFCFKDKSIIDDPSLIKVPFGDATLNNENLTIYIGGEKGPDKRLYLYGQYDEENQFFAGISSVARLNFKVQSFDVAGADRCLSPWFYHSLTFVRCTSTYISRTGSKSRALE